MKVYQSHGTSDPILPYQLGTMLKDFLQRNEVDLKFTSFGDGHTIPPHVISEFSTFLSSLYQ